MEKLYYFSWDGFRGGRVEGLFIATETDVEAAVGKEVYFGEILGKHSEVSGTIEAGEIQVMSDDQNLIDGLKHIFGYTLCGYNPLDYLRDEDEDESEWAEE